MQTPLPAASADAEQGKASISLTSYFDISEVVTCACHPNIHLQKGVCACPANTAFDSTTNKCVPN
jgi:hypothetical protein